MLYFSKNTIIQNRFVLFASNLYTVIKWQQLLLLRFTEVLISAKLSLLPDFASKSYGLDIEQTEN